MVILKNIIKTKLCPILSAKIFAQAIEDVPVIIQLDDDTIKENKVLPLDRKLLDLPIINSYAGYMSTNDIYKIVNNESIKYISFDSKVFTLLDIAKPATDSYFPQKEGYLGEGITVAIVDTGVVKHSDLVKPENRIVGFKDLINNKKSPYDDNGHGTHVG